MGTRNFELDSGAYYLNLLYNYYKTPGLHAPHRLLEDTRIYEAARLMVQVCTSPFAIVDRSAIACSEL